MLPLQLKTSTLNTLAKIKEKLQGAIPLSPAEMSLRQWARKMQHRIARAQWYRQRNAAYPYQSKRQMARNLRKIQKAESRGFDVFGRGAGDPLPFRPVAAEPALSKPYSVKSNAARAAARLGLTRDKLVEVAGGWAYPMVST